MTKKKTSCGELLQGKDGNESVIILYGDVPLQILQKIFSNFFQLEPPAPWDNTWILLPGQVCLNGCDTRSFALDMIANGINIEIPPVIPTGTPTFQEIFSIQTQ